MRPETYAEIDLDALAHNMEEMKRMAGKAEILAVLKANAYGHGAPEVFKALLDCGINRFAVANIHEALQLRAINPDVFIMVLGYVAPQNIAVASEKDIALTVLSAEYWETIKQNAKKPVKLHIKVNTGFNRIGFDPTEQSFAAIAEMDKSELAVVEGIYSHFALTTREDDEEQFRKFNAFVEKLEAMGINIPMKHMADSITAVDYPWARLDMVRLGAIMYGLKAGREGYKNYDLKPTMKVFTTVSQVREIEAGEGVSYDYGFRAPEKMEIASLAFGYADGIPRRMGRNGEYVVIKGQRAPLIGSMCMDQCMADLRGIEGVKAGDPAQIYDLEENSLASVYDLSRLLKTNKNDLIACLGKRVVRIYKKGGREWQVCDIHD